MLTQNSEQELVEVITIKGRHLHPAPVTVNSKTEQILKIANNVVLQYSYNAASQIPVKNPLFICPCRCQPSIIGTRKVF